jgi:hypothetical protein
VSLSIPGMRFMATRSPRGPTTGPRFTGKQVKWGSDCHKMTDWAVASGALALRWSGAASALTFTGYWKIQLIDARLSPAEGGKTRLSLASAR